MPKKVVGSMSEWSGVLKDFFRKLDDGSFTLPELLAFNERQNPFPEKPVVANIALAKTYELCGMKPEFEAAAPLFDLTEVSDVWKLLEVKSLNFAKLAKGYKATGIKLETFGVNLDKAIDPKKERRDADRDGTYLALYPRDVEAPEENGNQSPNERKEAKCRDMGLKARLLLGLAYFVATDQHLDFNQVTYCMGSRDRRGGVPCAHFYPVNYVVCVGLRNSASLDYVNSRVCARSEVSLPAEASEA